MIRSDQARLLQRKAARDLTVLDRLLDDAAIDDETLGYHAQQAAEKLIKALLALHGHDYSRSHNRRPASGRHAGSPQLAAAAPCALRLCGRGNRVGGEARAHDLTPRLRGLVAPYHPGAPLRIPREG